ncbi:hypothetical protein LRY60_00680 [Candidatus Woesebacteria bacterium]|nr:hypothetical protein [Candidatus Woesebacteria bacterium]
MSSRIDTEISLDNPDIPSAATVLDTLRKSSIREMDVCSDPNEVVRSVPVSKRDFFNAIEAEQNIYEATLRWLRELLELRNDIQPVFIFQGKSRQFEFGLQIQSGVADEPTLYALLDISTIPTDRFVIERNDFLASNIGSTVDEAFALPVTDIVYAWSEEKQVSVRKGLQPPSFPLEHMYLEIANSSPNAKFEKEKKKNALSEGEASEDTLTLTERVDTAGINTALHESGHRWAMFLDLDKNSEEQKQFRNAHLRGMLMPRKKKTLASIQREVAWSERVASAIARILKRKLAEHVPIEKNLESLQYALQTYDAAIIRFARKQQLPEDTLKSLLTARVNRTEIGWQQIQKTIQYVEQTFDDIYQFVAQLGTPTNTFDLRPAVNVTTSSWKLASENVEVTLYESENNEDSIDITIPKEGQRQQVIIFSKYAGIVVKEGLPSQEAVQFQVTPGIYESELSDLKLQVRGLVEQYKK